MLKPNSFEKYIIISLRGHTRAEVINTKTLDII